MSNKKPKQSDPETIPIQLDKNTTIYVKKGADVEKIRAKFLNSKGRGDYAYLFDYGNTYGRNKRF